MEASLSGKVALVTGGARGIGRATALRLARDGAAVVVNYHSNADGAEDVARAIHAAGGRALACRADIASLPDLRRLFRDALDWGGRLDVLVANAGVAAFGALADTTEQDFDRLFAVNAKGTFFCLQEGLRHLARDGRIVCVSTIGTIHNLEGGACYFGTKAAIEQFCRVVAKEVAARGITVNVVSPGFTATEMLLSSLDAVTCERLAATTPLGRLGAPEEIADVIAFLASPAARWITRQNLPVDGGIVSR